MPDNVKFYLIRTVGNNIADTVEIVKSKAQKIVFKGKGLLNGEIYFVKMDTTGMRLKRGRRTWISILLDNSSIEIVGDIKKWPEVKIQNSLTTNVYHNYYRSANSIIDKLRIQENRGDTTESKKLKEELKQFSLAYFMENMASKATALLIMNSKSISLFQKDSIYYNLPYQVKNGFYGKKLNEYLGEEHLSRSLSIGKEIPDFNVTTPDGKNVSILNLIRKNKITLIDFWASWCSPCREAIPLLKDVYAQFEKRGFSIVGVSSDKSEKDWRKALDHDGVSWSQVRDVNGSSGRLFQINGIPAYILVDPVGKIIASQFPGSSGTLSFQGPGITGAELSKTLSELLGSK